MKKEESLSVTRLIVSISKIEDPRRPWGNFLHRLVDILIITLFAIICRCETWEEIEDYGKTKETWLSRFLSLKNGVPSADTYRRLFERIKPEELEKAYREWITPYVGGCLYKQINLDGKTIRGASKMRGEESNLHMVSAWVREDGITLGQLKTDEKSNEIKAIPQLLGTLDVRGGTVTIDAIGCQRAIAEQIVSQEANYVLAVKGNQPTLLQEVAEYFTWATQDEIERNKLDSYEQTEKSHGRIHTRKITITTEVEWFESKLEWKYLRTLIMVERKTMIQEETREEKQYYISSLQAPADRFAYLIRGHWSIENQLHWVLDATFHEDNSLIHKDHSPQNLSVLRKIAMALLKKNTSRKASLRRKQNIAGWDDSFLASLFLAE